MDDCISRKAAIDICNDELLHTEDYSPIRTWNRILQLPSAQPERKKGKWIKHETESDRYDDMICPFCKKSYTVDAYRIDDIGFTAEDFNFCPNCGADMRGDKK